MGFFTAILEIIKSWLGWKQADAVNLPTKRLEELTHEETQLRADIRAAARAGNSTGVSELEARLDANHAERDALRAAQSHAGK